MATTVGPDYYNRGTIEVWDFIRDQDLNYHLGNAIKYIARAGHKYDAICDLTKAIHYLENEIEFLRTSSARVSEGLRASAGSDCGIFDTSTDFDR